MTKILSSPAKTFIIGEYLATAEGQCVVATTGPRFTLSQEANRVSTFENSVLGSVAESPAGLLKQWAYQAAAAAGESQVGPLSEKLDQVFQAQMLDQGKELGLFSGGFGASSSEFLLSYYLIAPHLGLDKNPWKVWALYRELTHRANEVSPSGADILAQWRGGIQFIDFQKRSSLDLSPVMDWSKISIFSATSPSTALGSARKVATHQNLAQFKGLAHRDHERLSEIVEQALEAIFGANLRSLGSALVRYADALAALGLEVDSARADREFFMQFKEVMGAKGAGAMLADSLVVVSEGSLPVSIIEKAEARGLKLVSAGIFPEFGTGLFR